MQKYEKIFELRDMLPKYTHYRRFSHQRQRLQFHNKCTVGFTRDTTHY